MVNSFDTFVSIKSMIQETEGIAFENQLLLCAGKQLRNARTLVDHNIQYDSVLYVIAWLK
jgi:hypothetical protein